MKAIPNPVRYKIVLLKSRITAGGGAEKYTERLAAHFHRRGCAVTLLTSGPLPKESLCEILSLKELSPFSYQRVKQYDRFCKETLARIQPDFIFGLDRNGYQTHLRASNGVHAAYLHQRRKECSALKRISFSLNPLHRTLLKLEKSSFEHPELKKLIANSHMVREEILQHYKVDPQKIVVIHNGMEWQEMERDFQNWEIERLKTAKEKNLPLSTFHFLFVGHNYARKGLEPLLRALSLISNEEFHLSVVGKEKQLPRFQALVRDLKLEKKVSFFPTQKAISFYQLADALVIPSFYDPFANVTAEALGMGLFVISSKHNGGSEVLSSDTGSILHDLFNPEALADLLLKALNQPKTRESAKRIRNSVATLDFSHQLERIADEVLL
jgi:UDP-glucose:(heptosyl)LPS alpha-1,3-glucosyltransferase